MGRFKLGSTVILLFPEHAMQFYAENTRINQPIKMGQKLGYFT
jgi:phosphatidylserine decarboxylase